MLDNFLKGRPVRFGTESDTHIMLHVLRPMTVTRAQWNLTRRLPDGSNCTFRLRNDLYCVGWGVKLYTLTRAWRNSNVFSLYGV